MNTVSLKIRAVSPVTALANPEKNADEAIRELRESAARGVSVTTFPELCLTGSTAGDLFFREDLVKRAEAALKRVAEAADREGVRAVLGLPILKNGAVKNASAIVGGGEIRIYEKSELSRAESRWFTPSENEDCEIFNAGGIPATVLFYDEIFKKAERAASRGAKLILIPAAVKEVAGTREKIEKTLSDVSTRFGVAIAFANAGEGESVTDSLYAGGAYLYRADGTFVSLPPYVAGVAETELVANVRNLSNTVAEATKKCDKSDKQISDREKPDKYPFVPLDIVAKATEIFEIQAEALARRLKHVGADKAVLGISGGLDSTLAVLVAREAMRRLNRPSTDVLAVTMPGGGTSGRTYENAKTLMKLCGAETMEIPIVKAFTNHLKEIGHAGVADIAYENAQARERTQILMDLANMKNGIVVGTGDLSEAATGFATYNGDHMSMYNVNASIPKTLMRAMVTALAEKEGGEPERVLKDVVATPVSPELKPLKDGETEQFSEAVVGPYVLVDFFLYRFWFKKETPETVLKNALAAFSGEYEAEALKRWLNAFLRRFLSAQFKRSCAPDGIDATGYSFSPRGALNLPSDLDPSLFYIS